MEAQPPAIPSPGREIPRAWFLDLYRWVDRISRTPVRGDNKTIRVNNGVISAVPVTGKGQSGRRFGVVTLDGLTVATGQVTASIDTLSGDSLTGQTVTINGAANGVQFNETAATLCWEELDGTWTANVSPWDYDENITGYGSGSSQVLGHGAGAGYEWYTVATFTCPGS